MMNRKEKSKGLLTPDGRLKSRKTRSVDLDSRGNGTASVTKTRLGGGSVKKTAEVTMGYVPTGKIVKTVTNKKGTVVSSKVKSSSPNKAMKKTDKIIKNVGRNANDSWSYKKGGIKKKTVKK